MTELTQRGTKNAVLQNVIWLGLGEGISRLLLLSLMVFAARLLGPEEFGMFSFAFAFVSLCVIFGDFGLPSIVTRELSQEPRQEKEFSSLIILKFLLAGGAFVLMWAGSFLVTVDPIIRNLILVLAVYILTRDFLEIIFAFLHARQRMEYEAIAKVLQAVIVVGIGFFFVSRIPSAEVLSYALLFATVIAAALISVLFWVFYLRSPRLRLNFMLWKRALILSWPLGFAMAFGALYIYADSLMLGFFREIVEVGWYNSAFRIMGAAMIPMTFIAASFYPLLSRLFKESQEIFQELWDSQMKIMIILAAPLVIGGFLTASKIVDFFYGVEYAPAVFALQLLIFAAGVHFLYNPYGMALIISGHQKKHLYGTVIVALANIFFNILFIPRFGLYGAGFATIISYFLLLILEAGFVRRFTNIRIWNTVFTRAFVVAITASLVMALVIQQPFLSYVYVPLLIVIGICAYAISSFFLFKFIS